MIEALIDFFGAIVFVIFNVIFIVMFLGPAFEGQDNGV